MGQKKSTIINTPQVAFYPMTNTVISYDEEDGDVTEEKFDRMRKILKEYEELNKLYDLCIKRIQSRNEK